MRPSLRQLLALSILALAALALVLVSRLFHGSLLPGMKPADPKKKVEFEMDRIGIRRLEDGLEVEGICWDKLTKFAIMTTDQGPWAEDLYWVLVEAGKKGCLVPQAWPRSSELLRLVQHLPGFKNEAVIAASGNTSGGYFECWSGEPGQAAGLSGLLAGQPKA